jgi:hypothetical protein
VGERRMSVMSMSIHGFLLPPAGQLDKGRLPPAGRIDALCMSTLAIAPSQFSCAVLLRPLPLRLLRSPECAAKCPVGSFTASVLLP